MRKGKIKAKLRYVPAILALGASVAFGSLFVKGVKDASYYKDKLNVLKVVLLGDFKDEQEANVITSYTLRKYFDIEPSDNYAENYKTAALLYLSLIVEDKNADLQAFGETLGAISGLAVAGGLASMASQKNREELKRKKEEEIEL